MTPFIISFFLKFSKILFFLMEEYSIKIEIVNVIMRLITKSKITSWVTSELTGYSTFPKIILSNVKSE